MCANGVALAAGNNPQSRATGLGRRTCGSIDPLDSGVTIVRPAASLDAWAKDFTLPARGWLRAKAVILLRGKLALASRVRGKLCYRPECVPSKRRFGPAAARGDFPPPDVHAGLVL